MKFSRFTEKQRTQNYLEKFQQIDQWSPADLIDRIQKNLPLKEIDRFHPRLGQFLN
jgi:hypothetical protein